MNDDSKKQEILPPERRAKGEVAPTRAVERMPRSNPSGIVDSAVTSTRFYGRLTRDLTLG